MRVPKFVTVCSVCHAQMGVTTNWSRMHAGQSVEWRVSRHRRRGDQTQPFCGGGGVMIPDQLAFPNEKVSA